MDIAKRGVHNRADREQCIGAFYALDRLGGDLEGLLQLAVLMQHSSQCDCAQRFGHWIFACAAILDGYSVGIYGIRVIC